MPKKSIRKNYIYNLVYHLLVLFIPIITTPYLSRVLGAGKMGEYSYASSIVAYFVLFATLGTTLFGKRAIGYNQDDAEGRSRAFWEIFLLRLIISSVALGAYVIYAFVIADRAIFVITVILATNILNIVLDAAWFLQGMEDFGKTTAISLIVRVVNIALIFIFVKTQDDLWKYALIMAVGSVLGHMAVWLFVPKYLCRVNNIRPFRNIKDVLQLFLPMVAIEVYTVVDKSMIGWLTDGYVENGYYAQAEKIVKITLTIVTALGAVTVPRISLKYKNNEMEQVERYVYRSYRYVWLMALPMTGGLIAVAPILIPKFLGGGFEKCITLVAVLGALPIFIGLSNVTGIQYFVPTGRQNVLTMTVCVGALINVPINAALIPFFGSIGAAIGTLVAEFGVAVAGFLYVKRKNLFSLKPVFACCWKYVIAAGTMTGILFVIRYFLPVTLWALILLIGSGMAIYAIAILLLRDGFAIETVRSFKDYVLKIFKRKKPVAEIVGDAQSAEIKTPDAASDEHIDEPPAPTAEEGAPAEEAVETEALSAVTIDNGGDDV